MFVYSKKIAQFIHTIKNVIKDILLHEVRLHVTGNWFMDRFGETYYPIAVGIYNDRNMLGYFDPGLYELGFHERLMYASEKQLHDIVRHELAHYLLFIGGDRLLLMGLSSELFARA